MRPPRPRRRQCVVRCPGWSGTECPKGKEPRMKTVGALAVASLLALAQQPANQDVRTGSDGKECGLKGTATSAAGKALNRLKNRYAAPDAGQIDPEVTLA